MTAKQLLLKKIKEYERIIIHGHTRPDGDCYGAQFGLYNIIKETYPTKKVFVVGEESEYVSFVGTPDKIKDEAYQDALSIVVDTGSENRISDQRYKLAKEIFKIDHHVEEDDSFYANYYWVDDSLPSCSQMIADFYESYQDQLKLSFLGARAMYVGIVTDTGRFRYRGVNRRTHELAGMLLDFGVDIEDIDNKLSVDDMNSIRLKGEVLSNFVTTEGGFIYYIMKKEMMTKMNVSHESASAMVNNLAGIEGYPVWALFIESADEYRIRLRSRGPEIQQLATKWRGGGHQKAAGATLKDLNELDEFISDVEKLIKDEKSSQNK